MRIHRFTVPVSCLLRDGDRSVDREPMGEEVYEDQGFLILPESYTEQGTPTRLVISCHGAGGTVTTDDSQIEHQTLTHYLVANGYAVMDVGGLPEGYAAKYGIDIRNNIGSPIALRSYIRAYRYCMEHFHLYPEVFVHGASMGGISSTNLVLSARIPVIAHSAYCPVLDTYNEIFLHPWSEGLPRIALGKFYGLEKDEGGEYLYDEKRIAPFNPMTHPQAAHYPVPVKFWHCLDDPTVSFEVTRTFIDRIRAHGGEAFLHPFPAGGHEPQLYGPFVDTPSGNTLLDGVRLSVTAAVEETYGWIRQWDR